jgi:hypothetical protein
VLRVRTKHTIAAAGLLGMSYSLAVAYYNLMFNYQINFHRRICVTCLVCYLFYKHYTSQHTSWCMKTPSYPRNTYTQPTQTSRGSSGTYSTTLHGNTPTIPIHRGKLQEDTLSSFMFTIFMEPLLRWLSIGNRGYKPMQQ